MGRIPNDEIERLKREISVAELARARGVELVKKGDDLHGRCPFHDDKTPSFVVTPSTNLWHCLGACQAGGSAIDFVMRAEGLSFRHAAEVMRRRGAALAPGAEPRMGPPPKQQRKRTLEALTSGDVADAELMTRVVEHYQTALIESPEAVKYLESRGLKHPEVIERFRLGYANRTLAYRLGSQHLKSGAEARAHLQRLGVLRETGHEHLNGSLVIPLFDGEGRVVQLYGRKIVPNLRPGTPSHLYLAGPQRGVFNREGLASAEGEAIVCEALIDALTFWVAGFEHVTSGYGVEGVTEEILDALEAAEVRVVKIAFDRDEAGDRGAQKLSERLAARGIESHRVLFPKGMDANSYALKLGPAAQSLGLVLRQAEWMRGGKRGATAATTTLVEEPAPSLVASSLPPLEPATATGGHHDVDVLPLTPPQVTRADEGVAASSAVGPSSTRPPTVSRELGPTSSEGKRPPYTTERLGEDLLVVFPARKWRVRAAGKATALSERVNVHISETRDPTRFFVDTVDLYSARQRAHFSKHAAAELEVDEGVLKRELGALVLEAEQRRAAEQVATQATKATPGAMSDEERDEALGFLRDPRLIARLLEDFAKAGVVGEETNQLVSYLAATSRKLDAPLAIVIQSSSAAGKSSLMNSVLELIPEEERVQYSAMTGQSLYYMGSQDLKHKVLAIAEEEGAERASYPLKILQSEGELTIASAGKDPASGKLVTHEYRLEGPVMIFQTTTAIDMDEELLNRCLVLTVDEGRAQTQAIHKRQRRARTLTGSVESEESARIRRVHRNAQRLLQPVRVVNPFAMELRFPDHTTRTRRDHVKYLTLIEAVTLLHQHQRPTRSVEHRGRRIEYIEATRGDIEIATRLAHDVLGQSLEELPPQTRQVLVAIESMVTEMTVEQGVDKLFVRFTRRDVRERTRWGDTQLKLHMKRLEELEYLLVHRLRGQQVQYELRYGGEGIDGGRFLIGLDDGNWAAEAPGDATTTRDRSVGGRGLVGGWSGAGRSGESDAQPGKTALNGSSAHHCAEIMDPVIANPKAS